MLLSMRGTWLASRRPCRACDEERGVRRGGDRWPSFCSGGGRYFKTALGSYMFIGWAGRLSPTQSSPHITPRGLKSEMMAMNCFGKEIASASSEGGLHRQPREANLRSMRPRVST